MRAAILSDLHLELQAFEPPASLRTADVVILAGDIHNGVEALRWARRCFPHQRIVQVAGNHEFFGANWHRTLDDFRDVARSLDISFLENDAIVVDGVQFLGATLWTDFEVFARAGRPLQIDGHTAKEMMQLRMLDYAVIRWEATRELLGSEHDAGGPSPATGPVERVLTPDDTARLHQRSRSWLADRLGESFDGPRVVVTHHLPSWRSVAPAFLHAVSNAAFASDLDALFDPVSLWVHGHTHHSLDYRAGTTRVVANPRGYALKSGADENPRFDPALVVDIDV
ncbi:MAG: metallophosphoesterase [Lautropia sp.]